MRLVNVCSKATFMPSILIIWMLMILYFEFEYYILFTIHSTATIQSLFHFYEETLYIYLFRSLLKLIILYTNYRYKYKIWTL